MQVSEDRSVPGVSHSLLMVMAEEQEARSYSLAWNWPTIMSTHIPLAKAAHVTKLTINGMGQYMPSLMEGTTKSHDTGCGCGADEAVETGMHPGKGTSRG